MILARRFLGLLATLLLLTSAFAPSARSGAAPELVGIRSDVAGDGSVRLALDFNGPAPLSQLVRSSDGHYHVVLVGVHRLGSVAQGFRNVGVIQVAAFAEFANVGTVLHLTVAPRSAIRLEEGLSTLTIHVSAPKGDEEARNVPVETPLSANGTKTVYVPLSFADVSEVAGILVKGAVVPSADAFNAQSPFAAPTQNPNSSSSSYNSSANQAPTYVTIPTAAVFPKDIPQGVNLDEHVAVDRRLNAIILTGTPDEIARYRHIISFVDVPARAVVLDTQIVELTQTAARTLGIDYSPGGTLASATYGLASGSPVSNGINFKATLNALEDNGQAKLLAQPRILALNNHGAAILSGTAQPIFTTLTVPGGSGTVLSQQLQYINVGISLEILPRISADGRVTAEVFSEVSTITGFVQTAPSIAVRQELTSAIVGDGESLLVGGLLQENEIQDLRKIPGLGSIPLIGSFFRNDQTTHNTTNLYVIITPHILSNSLTATPAPAPTPEATPTAPPGL